jgi:hypothetical protein
MIISRDSLPIIREEEGDNPSWRKREWEGLKYIPPFPIPSNEELEGIGKGIPMKGFSKMENEKMEKIERIKKLMLSKGGEFHESPNPELIFTWDSFAIRIDFYFETEHMLHIFPGWESIQGIIDPSRRRRKMMSMNFGSDAEALISALEKMIIA